MKLHFAWAVAGAVALLSVAVADVQAQNSGYYNNQYAAEEIVVCESVKNRTQYCQMDTRRGVVLINQLSRSACIEGETWGVDRRGLWVTQGCRAEFQAARSIAPGPSRRLRDDRQGVLVVCESRSSDQTYCPVRIRGGVQLNRQLSRTECVQGYNWDYDRRGIWVDQGCRAEFLVN